MSRRMFVFFILFFSISFPITSNYSNFLNTRGTVLKDMVKAVVLDEVESKEQNKEQTQQQAFSSNGGAASAYVFGGDEYMEKNRLTIFPDVKMLHRDLPGVSDGGDYSALLYFRGGEAYETITLVNGQPVYEPFVFDGKGSLVNPQLIKETKIYTSGIPVSYPDVLSGVIDIQEREGDLYNYSMDFAQSLTDLQLFTEGPILRGKSSFLISMRRTYYDYLLQLMNKEQNIIAPHIENYGQKFFIKLSSEHEMVMDFKTYYDFYNWNNSDFNLGQTGQHSSVSRRNFLQTKITSYWDDKLKTEIAIGMENSVLSKNSVVGSENASEKLRQEPFFIMADLKYRQSPDHLISTGFSYRQERIKKESENLHLLANYSYPGIANAVSSENYSMEYPLYALYLQDESTIVPDKFYFDAGIRYSFIGNSSLSRSKSFQPRIGFRLKEEGSTLRFSVGKYAQYNPKVVSSQFVDIFPEEAMQYSLGIDNQLGEQAEFSFGIFKKEYTSLIREQINNQGMITGYDNSKTGYAKGLEILFKKKKSDGWSAVAAYTNQDSYCSDPTRDIYPADHDQKHTYSLSGEFDLGKDWGLVLDWQYHSGRPYTDLTGATSTNVRSSYLDNSNQYNKGRLPDYSNLTLILEHKKPIWPFDAFEGQTYIGVANILNAENIYGYVWNDNYSVRTAVKMMPMTPLFGIRVKF